MWVKSLNLHLWDFCHRHKLCGKIIGQNHTLWFGHISWYGLPFPYCPCLTLSNLDMLNCLLKYEYIFAFNTLRPRQNGRHFTDDTFKPIFLNENIHISIKISLKFVPKVPINNIPALVQIMAWRRPGDKPLSEPMMVCLLTHICVTRPQWVNIILIPRNGTGCWNLSLLKLGTYRSILHCQYHCC